MKKLLCAPLFVIVKIIFILGNCKFFTFVFVPIIVFFLMFFVDFAWAMYVKALATNRHIPASLWSMFIASAGGVTVIGYTENHLLLIPAVVGGGIGTYCSKYFK